MSSWSLAVFYAAVVAVLVRTLTQENITEELRDWLTRHSESEAHPLWLRKLAYMPTCEFCSSFWISLFLVVAIFDYRLNFQDWRGYVVSIGTTMALANIYLSLFSLLRVDLRKEKAVATHVERRQAG